MKLQPDGVFLSNGPGDPEPCNYAIELIQQLLDINMPIFGYVWAINYLLSQVDAKHIR
jgi:carbamoyl-phosphate synthase small subunit